MKLISLGESLQRLPHQIFAGCDSVQRTESYISKRWRQMGAAYTYEHHSIYQDPPVKVSISGPKQL